MGTDQTTERNTRLDHHTTGPRGTHAPPSSEPSRSFRPAIPAPWLPLTATPARVPRIFAPSLPGAFLCQHLETVVGHEVGVTLRMRIINMPATLSNDACSATKRCNKQQEERKLNTLEKIIESKRCWHEHAQCLYSFASHSTLYPHFAASINKGNL